MMKLALSIEKTRLHALFSAWEKVVKSKVTSQEWGGEGEVGKTSLGRLSTFSKYQATHKHFPSNKSLSFLPPRPRKVYKLSSFHKPLSPVLRPSCVPHVLFNTERARYQPCWMWPEDIFSHLEVKAAYPEGVGIMQGRDATVLLCTWGNII